MIKEYFRFETNWDKRFMGALGVGHTKIEAYQSAHRRHRLATRIQNKLKWTHFKYVKICMGGAKVAVKRCDDGLYAIRYNKVILRSDLRTIAENIALFFNGHGYMYFTYYYPVLPTHSSDIPF